MSYLRSWKIVMAWIKKNFFFPSSLAFWSASSALAAIGPLPVWWISVARGEEATRPSSTEAPPTILYSRRVVVFEVFSAAEVMRLAAGALGRRPPPWPRTTTCPSPGRRRCSGSWQSARTPHRARALRPPVPRGGGREEEVGCLARARECGRRPPHHRALVWSSPGCCNMWGID